MRRARRKALTAAQLARQEVAQLFDAMLEDYEVYAVDCGAPDVDRLDAAFEAVCKLVEAEHVKRYGTPITDETDNWTTTTIGIQAGYLIGVQVGLRLRNAGVR